MHRISILGMLRMSSTRRLANLWMLGQILRVLPIGGAIDGVGRIHNGIRMVVGLKYRPRSSRVVVVCKEQALEFSDFSGGEMEIYVVVRNLIYSRSVGGGGGADETIVGLVCADCDAIVSFFSFSFSFFFS